MNVNPVNSVTSFNSNDSTNDSTLNHESATGMPSAVEPAVIPANLASQSHSEPGRGTHAASNLPLASTLQQLLAEYEAELPPVSASVRAVMARIVVEVERICYKSDRIQNSGEIEVEQLALARHRIQKCLHYYRLGSRQGRIELQSRLSTMIYRHIVPHQAQLGFSARYSVIEDFMQGFQFEVLNAFRRENELPTSYTPQTRLELAEYMAFTELYAKRRIALPGQRKQQLIVLRAQTYARRQPLEATLDLELAMDSAKGEEAEVHGRSPLLQQVREQMVSEAIDPTDSVIRSRVVTELIEYLESQGQPDCVDYLVLKLNDRSAPEIDELLGLSPRQRDYLQQRFKYHVEKFSRSHRWQLVHQWLGADLDQNLGMPQQQWEEFRSQLSAEQLQLLRLKHQQLEDTEIAKVLRCTPKQVQKRWVKLLELAWQTRNQDSALPLLD